MFEREQPRAPADHGVDGGDRAKPATSTVGSTQASGIATRARRSVPGAGDVLQRVLSEAVRNRAAAGDADPLHPGRALDSLPPSLGVSRRVLQRAPAKSDDRAMMAYSLKIPDDVKTLDAMYRLFERYVYGKEMNFTWSCGGYCDMSKNTGHVVPFLVHKESVEQRTDPEVKRKRDSAKSSYGQLDKASRALLSAEVDKRYYAATGDKPGSRIKPGEEGKAKIWEQTLMEVVEERRELESLPPAIKALMGAEASFKPADYQQLLRIAGKLESFSAADLEAYKLLAIRATDDLNLFELSVEMFLARKEELAKAMAEELAKRPARERTLEQEIAEQWKGLDAASIATMSEADRYALAREQTSRLTEAHLKYMKDHPGETAGNFLKAATLMNTADTFKGISGDLAEAASGDANTFARWAAGTGAGAKLSGWMLAVAGVLFVASWLTGVGELATIAAAAAVLLGTTLTLSTVESELRIKAASQATTSDEFKREVELAAAARANVMVGLALIVLALVLRFTAKALFPKQVQAARTWLANLRERVRLKGSVHELKGPVATEVAARRAALESSAESARQGAAAAAAELEGLTTEEFVARLEKPDGGFLDQSKLPPEQQVNYRELMKSPEGKAAVEQYRLRMLRVLKSDVPGQIDALASKFTTALDEFAKAVEAAKNHDEMNAALSRAEAAFSEESLQAFAEAQQAKLRSAKLEEAAGEAHREALALAKEAIVKRATARIARQPEKFELVYTAAELDAIVAKGKQLGLADRVVEDMIFIGSRKAKLIAAADLLKQMDTAVEVQARGYPMKFKDLADFQAFSKDLIDGLKAAGLPADDVRIQGSAMRSAKANDVDIAVFVPESKFAQLLIDRYSGRIEVNGATVDLRGRSLADLTAVGAQIDALPQAGANATARTFARAVREGTISSKGDVSKPLKQLAHRLTIAYPHLNLEAISVLREGSTFDLRPDVQVKAP